jgi:hypothetical protein
LKILVNAIGIVDSGGLKVLEKFFAECILSNEQNEFIILLTKGSLVDSLKSKYQNHKIFTFKQLEFKNYIHRLFYENTVFKKLIALHGIDFIYNFTATAQFFLNCPQLVKIHNLLYYSKKLDSHYIKQYKISLWLKQVFFKRIVFKAMLNQSQYIEIQAKHVQAHLSDFIKIKNKNFFIKSDIDVESSSFNEPKKYDFTRKLKFLFIAGPHFEYTHKNFKEFVNAMTEIDKLGINFEINITLTKEQLLKSKFWNNALNIKTNFYGYIKDSNKMNALFSDNTILVSTSVIETLGLHVIEAIKNGIATITPNEYYAIDVYGKNRYAYDLFDIDSFRKTVKKFMNDEGSIIKQNILLQQEHLKLNEMSKLSKIDEVFKEVLHV